jgi:hypothetical protein
MEALGALHLVKVVLLHNRRGHARHPFFAVRSVSARDKSGENSLLSCHAGFRRIV